MAKLFLTDLRSVCYSDWLASASNNPCIRHCFTTSGYEGRAISWTERTLEQPLSRDHLCFHTVGFDDFRDSLSRRSNDAFYARAEIAVHQCGSSRENDFLVDFEQQLSAIYVEDEPAALEIHVDYSCMPRRWYCALPELISRYLRPVDKAFFWYTPGRYSETTYPTAGTSDFKVFSGRPTLSAQSRTHLFGLGFDRVRSQAIWSVLDPHSLVCFYADPAADPAYVSRVKRDNREALNAAAYTFTVPFDDFVLTYSKLVSVVSQFRSSGDVVIVPDGPKPLVLASSLVPLVIDDPSGVVCFHVAKRQMDDFTPVDVAALGDAVGFSFCGIGAEEPRLE